MSCIPLIRTASVEFAGEKAIMALLPDDASFIRLEKQVYIEDGRMFKPSDKYVVILSYQMHDTFEKDVKAGTKSR